MKKALIGFAAIVAAGLTFVGCATTAPTPTPAPVNPVVNNNTSVNAVVNSSNGMTTFIFQTPGVKLAVPRTGVNNPNEGHIHLHIDGGPEIQVTNIAYTIQGLAPGTHTATFGLANDEHEAETSMKTITFVVK